MVGVLSSVVDRFLASWFGMPHKQRRVLPLMMHLALVVTSMVNLAPGGCLATPVMYALVVAGSLAIALKCAVSWSEHSRASYDHLQ